MTESPKAGWRERVSGLLDFPGEAQQFWESLCHEAVETLSGFSSAAYVDVKGEGNWQCVGVWPMEPKEARRVALHDCAPVLAKRCETGGGGLVEGLPGDPARTAAAVQQPLPGGVARLVLIAAVPPAETEAARAALLERLRTVVSAAPAFQVQHTLRRTRENLDHFSSVLDLLTMLNGQEKFMGASMMLVNELSSRLQADRVSLGWLRKEYIRIQAVSHMEKFSKHMDGVQELEAAMEEAYEQDAEIVCPPLEEDPEAPLISRDHRRFAEIQGAGHMVSVPLRDDGEPMAVLTLERKSGPFSESEIRWLRLCADQVAPRLLQVEASDVWFGRRWGRGMKKTAGKCLGVEHTGWKILGLIGVAALAFLFFGRWPHRPRGEFELSSGKVRILSAPFNGFIDETAVEKGDVVEEGQVLLYLDRRDLLIEKASAMADLSRNSREMEKARAEGQLAEMRMAEAMAEQARAKLEQIEDRLEKSRIRMPFSGAVVDGDLKDRVGAPVQRGDVLFRVARWDAMIVSAELDESEIDYLEEGAEARLIFASRPEDPVKARVSRIEPMAQVREERNVFVARLRIEDEEEPWWRPGMSGTVRVDAGKARPIWLLTRRTLDYFRLRWGW